MPSTTTAPRRNFWRKLANREVGIYQMTLLATAESRVSGSSSSVSGS